MKLSLILEAIDRASRPVKGVDRAVHGLGRASREASRDVRSLDQKMDGASRSAGRLERASRRIGTGIAAGARRGIGALAALDRKLTISRARMEKMAYSAGTLIGSTIRGGVMAGGAIAGAGLSAALYKIVTAGVQMENYRAQLQTFTGSAEGAALALKKITDFAAQTPYEMSEVIEGFIAAKQNALDPFSGSLTTIGNTAAAMNRTMKDTADMLGDASRFQFDRALDFGIVGSVKGSKVALEYFNKANKKVVRDVKKDTEEVRKTMLGILDERFSGAMELRARTTAGKMSTIMDNITIAAARVWEGGFGAATNRQMDRFSTWLDSMEKDGSLKKWADDTGEGIGNVVSALGEADWKGTAADIRTIGSAFSQLAGFLRDVDYWGNRVAHFLDAAPDLWGAGDALGSFKPIAPGVMQYQAPGWLRAPGPRGGALVGAQGRPRGVGGKPARGASEQDWQRALSAPRSLPARPATRPAASAPANGKVEISLNPPQGWTAKPTKVASTNLDLEVNTGRRMGGFA